MAFTLTTTDGTLVLAIAGELDAVTVPELRSAIDQIVAEAQGTESHKRVVVNLSRLHLIDSSGIGAVVSLYKRVRAAGSDVEVTGLHGQPLVIFRLLRLDAMMLTSKPDELRATPASVPAGALRPKQS